MDPSAVRRAEEKIASLVERALGTDSEEEARESALIALRLAAKTGAVIRVKGGKTVEVEESPSGPQDPGADRRSSVPENFVDPPFSPWDFVGAHEPRGSSTGNGRRKTTESGVRDPRSFKNRFAEKAGSCKHCGRRWNAGEIIAQRDGERRAYHAGCAAQRR